MLSIRRPVALLALLTASAASAQVSLSVQMNTPESPVVGLPFSADQDVRTVQHLADGASLTHQVKGHIYRSADGVERFDGSEVPTDPGAASAPEPSVEVLIVDRAKRTSILLNTRLKTASVQIVPANAKVTVTFLPQQQPRIQNKLVKPENVTTVDLGQRTEGPLSLVGRRVSGAIPIGAVGNNEPLPVTEEDWIAPDLKLVVKQAQQNPLAGERTFELTNISRGEPDPALFLIPNGYRVIDRPPMPTSAPPRN